MSIEVVYIQAQVQQQDLPLIEDYLMRIFHFGLPPDHYKKRPIK